MGIEVVPMEASCITCPKRGQRYPVATPMPMAAVNTMSSEAGNPLGRGGTIATGDDPSVLYKI